MAEKVENLILEQLKQLRADMRDMRAEMSHRFDEVEAGQQALQGVVMGLGHYMNSIDHRVESLEEKIGASK